MADLVIREPIDRDAAPTLALGWREPLPDDFLGVFSVELRDFTREVWRVRIAGDGQRRFRYLRTEPALPTGTVGDGETGFWGG